MQIKAIHFYILPGEPIVRAVDGGNGGMEQPPQSWTGMFTHSHGLRGGLGNPSVLYRDDKPSPTFRSVLRVVTDGELSAYTDFETGFHADDLVWKARQFMATIAPMLIGIDAFDREHIWQKLGTPSVSSTPGVAWLIPLTPCCGICSAAMRACPL